MEWTAASFALNPPAASDSRLQTDPLRLISEHQSQTFPSLMTYQAIFNVLTILVMLQLIHHHIRSLSIPTNRTTSYTPPSHVAVFCFDARCPYTRSASFLSIAPIPDSLLRSPSKLHSINIHEWPVTGPEINPGKKTCWTNGQWDFLTL